MGACTGIVGLFKHLLRVTAHPNFWCLSCKDTTVYDATSLFLANFQCRQQNFNGDRCFSFLFTFTEFTDTVAIGWNSLLVRITWGMAALFHSCSLLGFLSLKALEGLKTQGVAWPRVAQCRNRDWVKSARKSHAIYYKINDDVCVFHAIPYTTLQEIRPKVKYTPKLWDTNMFGEK